METAQCTAADKRSDAVRLYVIQNSASKYSAVLRQTARDTACHIPGMRRGGVAAGKGETLNVVWQNTRNYTILSASL
jgi:hypothetical protein